MDIRELFDLIEILETLDPDAAVMFDNDDSPGREHSYRGYYADLAFSSGSTPGVGEFLAQCRRALGSTYTGWRGGDFVMDENTPLWHAGTGETGEAIVDHRIDDLGNLILVTKKVDL